MHIDTTWKFRAMYEFRDTIADEYGVELLIHQNPEARERGINPFDHGPLHTDLWKSQGLRQALAPDPTPAQSVMPTTTRSCATLLRPFPSPSVSRN